MTFNCATCGGEHDLEELFFGAEAPDQWGILSDAQVQKSELYGEQCIIQAEGRSNYFIRACLEIPVTGRPSPFVWGVWCSLSEQSFEEMNDHWEDPNRQSLGPYFGWLCTRIPEYPDTMFLKCMVHQRPVGERPTVELEPMDHPLSIHQRQGIAAEEMERMAMQILHAP